MKYPIGSQVRKLRRARDLTQRQLAEMAGLHHLTISRLEHGAADQMYADTLGDLAVALHVSADTLLGLTEQVPLSTPVPAQPQTITPGPRGAVRQQIVEVLTAHPEGLSPVQIRQHLGVDRDLGSTVKAMARDGLLTRLAQGLYGVRQNN
jgi:transcriptional regulator with XRE-family HTH domain